MRASITFSSGKPPHTQCERRHHLPVKPPFIFTERVREFVDYGPASSQSVLNPQKISCTAVSSAYY